MKIRPERPDDYVAIAEVHARAFGHGSEPAIVALLRQYPTFDAELSLVAEVDGTVVGHALFMPWTVQLLDDDVSAVNLAPLGVRPSHHGRGIGGALMAAGHHAARERGHTLSVLLGHDTYYPRFGYRTRAYGPSVTVVPVAALRDAPLERRNPASDDVAALRALWRRDEAAVDFALDPGDGLVAWASPVRGMQAQVYLEGERIVGYTRVQGATPAQPEMFLAYDATIARRMAATLAAQDDSIAEFRLPIHPRAGCAAAFDAYRVTPWNAAMACGLEGTVLDRYFDEVERGRRPGRIVWPTAFSL